MTTSHPTPPGPRRVTTTTPRCTVMAIDIYGSNAKLISACASLGYLRADAVTLDPTYGMGTFWAAWRPDVLIAHDLDPAKSPTGESVDATRLPYADRSVHTIVLDPPYKLNGTPDPAIDGRYGVHQPTRWQDRMALLGAMLAEGARVLGDGFLLVKCQDQVCSGNIGWQTIYLAQEAERAGLGLVDRLDMLSYRPQPRGTRQVTARRNASTMLVFRRGRRWRP